MSLREALNVCFALIVENADADGRHDFESKLNGWDEYEDRANRALWNERLTSDDG